MKSLLKLVVTLAIVGGLGYAAWALVFKKEAGGDQAATYVVKKEKFVRRVTAEGNLRAVKATKIATPRSAGAFGPMKIAWLAPDGVYVKKGEVVAKFDPSEPEKQLRDGKSDLASADAKLASARIKAKTTVAGRETDAQTAADELDQQKRFAPKDPEIFSRNQIVESEIDETLAGAKQDHATQAKSIEGRRSTSTAAVIDVERKKAKLAIDHASQALSSMEVAAPNDGVLVLQRNWSGALPKLGDSMFPGQSLAEIPILDAMEAEVYVLEVDGSGLVDKQPADVIVEARPEMTWHGKIRVVDKLAQPRDQGSPVNYFGVTIALDQTDKQIMKPGQRVRATLVLDQEDALVVPRQAVFEKDGKPIIYKQGASGFSATTVELGVASAGRVVIKKGLNAGDVIALRDPTRALDALGSGSGSGSGK
ncbi:MAG: HlyD family efflux transporter periplasmic adaptor subunit [Kofleriaceae bacterium]